MAPVSNLILCEALAKLFVLRTNATSFIAYLLVNLHKFTCSVGSSRRGVAEGEDGITGIRWFCITYQTHADNALSLFHATLNPELLNLYFRLNGRRARSNIPSEYDIAIP
jgi:hypothetical protein